MASDVPIHKRVLAVKADLGEGRSPRFVYGSGLRLGRGHMLTAAHVVAGAVSVSVRDPKRVTQRADLESALIGDPDRLDLAIVPLSPPEPLADVGLARVNRDVPTGAQVVEGCWAVGYPTFSEVDADGTGLLVRSTEQVNGVIPPLSHWEDGMLSLRVTSAPERLPPADRTLAQTPWSGMSGAAVFAENLLVGVVTAHAPRRGASDITVTPLDRLLDPSYAPSDADEWWARLGVDDPQGLPLLPRAAAKREPEYRATLRVIRNRAKPYLLGRRKELEQIAAFATGGGDAIGTWSGTEGYLWLVGSPWAGKTALLAEAVHTMPPDVDVVAFFLMARESRASREHFLTAVVPQLASLLDEESPSVMTADVWRMLWERATDRAERRDRHLLLVVDGLDEDLSPAGTSVAGLLPEQLKPPARVLVASRLGMVEHGVWPPDVDIQHPLRRAAAARIVIADSAPANELKDLANQEIDALLSRLEQLAEGEADLAFDVLGILAAAGGALTVTDLAELTGGKPRRIRSLVTTRAGHTLEGVGAEHDRRYQFAHLSLLSRCRQHPDVGDPRYWDMLTTWADEWRSRRWPRPNGSPGTPRYLLDTYPLVLSSAGSAGLGEEDVVVVGQRQRELTRLVSLLTDIAWLDTATSVTGVHSVLTALRTAVGIAPASTLLSSRLRLVQLQAHVLRRSYPALKAGQVATLLAWEALRGGNRELAVVAADWLTSCPRPQLIPVATTERTAVALSRTVGRHAAAVRTVAAMADGSIASGGEDGVVRLWQLDGDDDAGRTIGQHDGPVRAVAATADGRLVSCGDDGLVRLWDRVAPGGSGRVVGYHEGLALAVAVLEDGRVVSGSVGVRIWDLERPNDPALVLGADEVLVGALAATADGRIVLGGPDGIVLVWDAGSSDEKAQQWELGRHVGWVHALAITADGHIASGGDDGVVRLWDPADPGYQRELGRHQAPVWAVAGLPDGRVVSAGDDGVLRLWDPRVPDGGGRELGRPGWSALTVAADGRVVSGGDDGLVKVWDPDVMPYEHADVGQPAWRTVAVTPDGRVVSGAGDGEVRLWDPRVPGGLGSILSRLDGAVSSVVVTSKGLVVYGVARGALEGKVWICDPARPESGVREVGRHPVLVQVDDRHNIRVSGWVALAAAPDGRVVSGGGDGTVRLWDSAVPGDPGRGLGRHDRSVRAVAVAHDGRVVSGSDDGVVCLWDPAASDDPGRELGRHEGDVRALAVSADGLAVSAGDDGTVRLWDLTLPSDGGRELGRHNGSVLAVAVGRSGYVLSGGADGIVRLWHPTIRNDPGQTLCHHETMVTSLAIADDDYVVVGTVKGVTMFRLVM